MEYGLCPKCADSPKPKRVYQTEAKLRSVGVLKCPHNLFRPGRARFNQHEWREGLKAGSWPLGMIVRLENGQIVAVCGIGKHYREPAEQLPAQWVRQA